MKAEKTEKTTEKKEDAEEDVKAEKTAKTTEDEEKGEQEV